MYRLHHNQFELSIVITISYKSLSLNQTIENPTDPMSCTQSIPETHKGYQALTKENKQNSDKLIKKLTQKRFYQTKYTILKDKNPYLKYRCKTKTMQRK